MSMKVSLKYRIAGIIFILEAIMMVTVLVQTLGYSLSASQQQLAANEEALLGAVSGFARTALLTEEYGDIQPYFQQILNDPHVTHLMLADINGQVVASTDYQQVGEGMPLLKDKDEYYWRRSTIENVSGSVGEIAIQFTSRQLRQVYAKSQNLGMMIALTGMVIIAIVGVLVGRILTRRLDSLTLAVEQLSNGVPGVRSGVRGNDEVGILGRNFDHMADVIEHNTQQLERKVEERTRDLVIAKDQALQASKAKSEFLSSVSHELRTPLNSIIGFTGIIKDELAGPLNDEQKKQVKLINESAEHLLNLVNDILNLARIEAGRAEIVLSKFNFNDLLIDVVNQIEVLCNKKNIKIYADIGEFSLQITTDRQKLYQILINLAGNAVKFTDQGEIGVRTKVVGRDFKIDVYDTGVGIEKEHLDLIFEAFKQSDSGDVRSQQGTGLGLTISKRFAEMLNGEISVTSAPGKGSTFTLLLKNVVSDNSASTEPEPDEQSYS